MKDKRISRRLDTLKKVSDRGRPCRMTVKFQDGSTVVTDSGGVIDLCRSCGETIEKITADRPEYAAMAAIMTVICHPVPNRDIQDFE